MRQGAYQSRRCRYQSLSLLPPASPSLQTNMPILPSVDQRPRGLRADSESASHHSRTDICIVSRVQDRLTEKLTFGLRPRKSGHGVQSLLLKRARQSIHQGMCRRRCCLWLLRLVKISDEFRLSTCNIWLTPALFFLAVSARRCKLCHKAMRAGRTVLNKSITASCPLPF